MDEHLVRLLTEFYNCQQALNLGPSFNNEVRKQLNDYLNKLYSELEKMGLIIEPHEVDYTSLLPRPSRYQVKDYEERKFKLQDTQMWLSIFMQR